MRSCSEHGNGEERDRLFAYSCAVIVVTRASSVADTSLEMLQDCIDKRVGKFDASGNFAVVLIRGFAPVFGTKAFKPDHHTPPILVHLLMLHIARHLLDFTDDAQA